MGVISWVLVSFAFYVLITGRFDDFMLLALRQNKSNKPNDQTKNAGGAGTEDATT